MSHDVHATADASLATVPLPPSLQITTGVRFLLMAGVLLAILQGAFVVSSSGFGRVWPSSDSAKVPLPPFAP